MRLFFALWPPLAAAEQLAAIAARCAGEFGGRPMRQETLHLTLAFLGEVPTERLPLLIETARTIHPATFAITLDRVGYWRQQRLLWAGCSAPTPALDELAGALQGALGTAGFAVDRAPASFTPHVTLLRKVAAEVPDAPRTVTTIEWRCDGFALVCSQRTGDGPSYVRLSDFPGAA